MIVLDEERLQYIFSEISKGFRHSPLEIALFFISVAAIITGFLIVSKQYSKIRVKKLKEEAHKRYEKIIKKLVLTPSEILTLEMLTKYLPDNKPINLLVENRSTFNLCANLLKSETDKYDREISALRFKLGFKISGATRIPISSVDLPERTRLILVISNKTQKNSILLKITENHLEIELTENISGNYDGKQVRVYFKNQNGIFYFHSRIISSRIISQTNRILKIAHSERIKKIQRRRYYRKKVKILSIIRTIEKPSSYTKVILRDLSGGGASFELLDQHKNLKPGETIELITQPIKRNQVKTISKIVRITENGKLYHVEFEGISDRMREEIISYLFSTGKP